MPGETAPMGRPADVATRAPAPGGAGEAEQVAATPRPEVADAGHDRRARWIRSSVIAVLAVTVVLRFLTSSPMWLDEAQTVNIAGRSLPHLFSALREDGAPPLYYVLLHGWMAVFGTGSFAVRTLSGLFSVAALVVMGVAARRFRLLGDSPWPAVLLLATCPFAVRYATEARMYSLLLLLVLLALLAYERVWTVGGRWPIAAAAVVTGALLLTHYWSLFLLATAAIGAIVAAWRGIPHARRLLLPMAIGCLAFVPWLPTFAYQSAHTGAPWASPPGVDMPLVAMGSWVGTGPTAPVLRWSYYLLAAMAVAGYVGRAGGLTFRRPMRRPPLVLLGLAAGTLLLGTIASELASNAYSPRYSTIVLAPVLLVVAAGFGALRAPVRPVAIAIICGLGLVSSALIPHQLRTQAGQVATVLAAAKPTDLVVFCPDQLGPAVHRLAPDAGTQVVYPTFGSSAMVDWVDYAARNSKADPVAFAREALQRAEGHTIWFVYANGYPTFDDACMSLYTSFTAARGRPVAALDAGTALESEAVAEFPAR